MFTDITTKETNTFTVDQPGQHVLFMYNKSGTVNVEITAKGAEVYIIGLYVGRKQDKFELNTIQHHTAPGATSDLFIKGVFFDEAKFIYDGLIRIDKAGQQTYAYQKNQNLIMSDKAFVASEPNLEILANDVFCTHGSTTARLNRDQLLYAESRGIAEQQAKNMLVEGFINDVFLRLDGLGEFSQLLPYRDALISGDYVS